MSFEYVGFNRLRPGRIHVFCPGCGMKRSNMPRAESAPFDPPTATLVGAYCERCSDGCKIEGPAFFRDAEGRELCQFCGKPECGGPGSDECDEGLIHEAAPEEKR